jgi:hypothetical protein
VAYAVAKDASGNVIVVGSFSGTANFGGTALTSAGDLDIFIAKYGATGAHLWSKRVGGTGADAAYGVAVDGSGNVFVGGSYSATVDFGGGNVTTMSDTAGFVAKYAAADGAYVWARSFTGTFGGDAVNAVAVDPSGDVFVTGVYKGYVDFGAGQVLSTSYTPDIFLAKYAGADGAYRWMRGFGNTSADSGNGVAVDGAGNVAMTGYCQSGVDFGGGTLNGPAGTPIAFLAKYGPTGTHLWSKVFGSNTNEPAGQAVAMDASGNVVVAGKFDGTVDFGGGGLATAGSTDVFVGKYAAANGAYVWARRLGGTGPDVARAVRLDTAGDVVVAGSFNGAVDFGGGTLTSAGGTDGFVAKYSGTDGSHFWSKQLGGPGEDYARAVALDLNVVVAGEFTGTASFEGGNLTAGGGSDGFVSSFLDPHPGLCGNGTLDAGEQCDSGPCCSSTCQFQTAGTVCRAAAGACDEAETCSGSASTCPADVLVAAGTVCRASTGSCDPQETCTGAAAACPADVLTAAGTTCRAAAGDCDVAEACTGASGVCPTDAKQPSGYECRASAGACDPAETCNGSADTCPADARQPAGTSCRVAAGPCDVAETCDGTAAACPADAKLAAGTTCRAATGECDLAETCDGVAVTCPTDAFKSSGTACTSDGNPCTLDVCNGSGTCTHAAGNAGAVCRAAAGPCDLAETCTGSSTTCPTDVFAASGAAGSPTCAPYLCAGGVATCRTSCTSSAQCASGATCTSNVCVWNQVCGNGTREGTEQCDQGAANGTAGSCCTTGCTFVAAGTSCNDWTRGKCSGASGACPGTTFPAAGTACP